jgi:hypothetical protein
MAKSVGDIHPIEAWVEIGCGLLIVLESRRSSNTARAAFIRDVVDECADRPVILVVTPGGGDIQTAASANSIEIPFHTAVVEVAGLGLSAVQAHDTRWQVHVIAGPDGELVLRDPFQVVTFQVVHRFVKQWLGF